MKLLYKVRQLMPAALPLLLLAVAGLSCAEQHQNPVLAGQDVRVSFLHTSDIHGRLLPYRMEVTKTDEDFGLDPALEPFGGIARMGYIINRERARGERVLYFDSGDVFQGAPIFNAFGGEAEFRAMGYLNPDAMVIGNHEFDTGLQNLIDKLKLWLGFPMLGANYYFYPDNELGQIVQPYILLNSGGLKIAVIGIGDFSSLSALTDIGNSLKMMPLDVPETIQYYVGMLRPQVDLVVLLSHAGLSHDQEMIARTEGVDIVFGGHLHIVLSPPAVLKNRKGEDVLLVHSGAFAKYVGRLDVVLRQDEFGRFRVATHDYQLFPVDSTVKEDPKLVQLMEDYRLQLNQMIDLTSTYGYSPKLLTKYGYEGGDSALGNMVSEAIRRFARVDMGFTNTLGIRSNMYPGPITSDDMYNIFPFENTITLMYISGVDLRTLFDFTAQRSSGRGCVSQLQVAGVKFVMNCSPEPPPFYYTCYNCYELDDQGKKVEKHWAGCLADCIPKCKTADCWQDCFNVGYRKCVEDRSDKVEDGLCLDACLPYATKTQTQAGVDRMLQCFDDCFPRAEDIALSQCPDSKLVEDPSKCKSIPLLQNEIYEVATNDYIAQGGSGFTMLKSNNTQQDTGLPLREAVLEMIMSQGSCLETCRDSDGDYNLDICPVYNDCIYQVSDFLSGFCAHVDDTGGAAYVQEPEGCGVDTGLCAKDSECYPVEELCSDGLCTPCVSNGQCVLKAPGSICVEGWCVDGSWRCVRGRCLKSCEDDAGCPGGEIPGHNSCVSGFCYPRQGIPCMESVECAEPFRSCFGDAAPCNKDEDCPAGNACQARLCVPEIVTCKKDSECKKGKCFRGVCGTPTPKCQDSSTCGGAECVDGYCSSPCSLCSADLNCPSGFACIKHLCVKNRQECLDNRCRLACKKGTDCMPGDACQDGFCIPRVCTKKLYGEQLCETNNMFRAQERCLAIPCVDSEVDGRIGRILPENLGEMEFGFVPNNPEDLDNE